MSDVLYTRPHMYAVRELNGYTGLLVVPGRANDLY